MEGVKPTKADYNTIKYVVSLNEGRLYSYGVASTTWSRGRDWCRPIGVPPSQVAWEGRFTKMRRFGWMEPNGDGWWHITEAGHNAAEEASS